MGNQRGWRGWALVSAIALAIAAFSPAGGRAAAGCAAAGLCHFTVIKDQHVIVTNGRSDDQQFLKHSLAYRTDGDPRIEYQDVVITRWPPAERVYGKA